MGNFPDKEEDPRTYIISFITRLSFIFNNISTYIMTTHFTSIDIILTTHATNSTFGKIILIMIFIKLDKHNQYITCLY